MATSTSTTPINTWISHRAQDAWITPQEQLKRLALPFANKISSIFSNMVPDICQLIAEYALDDYLWEWLCLYDLKSMPQKIPPLPPNIIEMFQKRCPIYGTQIKPDGTFNTVKDTHFLTLICEEFGTLNQFERDILKPYAKKYRKEEEGRFQFAPFDEEIRERYGNVPFPRTHWAWIVKKIIPNSIGKPYSEQVTIVHDLNLQILEEIPQGTEKSLSAQESVMSENSFGRYEVLSFHSLTAGIFLHKIATGENLYTEYVGRGCAPAICSVKESFNLIRVVVGWFGAFGLSVMRRYDSAPTQYGISAMRTYPIKP